MKTPSKTLTTILAATVATFGTCLTASAQLMQVNSGNPILNVNPVPSTTQGPSNDGGTTGSDGYVFFRTTSTDGTFTNTGDISSPVSYVSSITPPGNSGSGTNSQLVIAGTNYSTGAVSNTIFGNQTTNSADLATIVLGGTGPTPTFDIGILADNTSFSGTSLYTLSLYSGLPGNAQIGTTLAVNTTTTGSTKADDFYYAQVTDPTGGANGDYLVVRAGSTLFGNAVNDAIALGGLTFDTVAPIPEPSTWALMLGGLGALLTVTRLRRSQA